MAIASNFPTVDPSLLLDFANTKRLDSRVTFTRTTTATYYDGVTTAKAEENLLLQSQTFNVTWSQTACSVTADTDTAPDGTTTADSVTEDGTTAFRRITSNPVGLVASTVYTLSVFVKQKTGSRYATIGFNSDGFNYVSATFDLSSGTNTQTLSAGYTSVSATITASVNSWYRVTLTATTNAASTTNGLAVLGLSATSTFTSASRGFDSYLGNGTSTILYWGAQLEQRSSVSSYTATTTQAITNYIPVLLTAASGVPRFDHNPTTDESLGLLIEEARTNLLTYSGDFSNAAWTKTRSSITSNTIVAPDGTLTGDKLVEDTTATSTHVTVQGITQAANTVASLSVFAKAAERTFINLRLTQDGTNLIRCGFDLTTGTAGTPEIGGNGSGATASITSVGNGWYRCSLSGIQSTTVANPQGQIFIATGTTSASASYTGNGYSGIYIWGAQLEAAAFPTSYIPTVAATVTRNADAASMTGPNFSSWYNAGEGTLYAEWIKNGISNFQSMAMITDGISSPTNNIGLLHGSGSPNNARFDINVNGTAQASLTLVTASVVGTAYKTIGTYKANDFAGVANAGTVQTDTSGNVPVVNQLGIGNNTIGGGYLNGTIKKFAYYPLRLTNANLQALTS